MNHDLLVSHGDAIKVGADGKIAGLLVKFGSPERCDTDREFFTKNTDFGFRGRKTLETDVYYHHGQDPDVGLEVVGTGTCKMVDDGVWFEGQLDMRHKYAKRMVALGKMKDDGGRHVLGMSSGSAGHLVKYRDAKKGTREITRWPLGLDASLTPTPADCDTYCYALKSAAPAPSLEQLCERHAVKADGDLDLSGSDAHEGLLVALYVAAEPASKLAIDGGEKASDLHVTLTYSKDGAPYDELTWCQVVTRIKQYIADYVAPFSGQIAGVGRFSASETSGGKDVFYASVDVPGLSALREMVREALRGQQGVRASTVHGFTPHVTLRYLEPTEAQPLDRLDPVPVVFDRITLSLGGRRVDIPMSGGGSNDYLKSDKAAKGELDEALAEAAARRGYWDLQSAFDDKVREIAEDVEDGAADGPARLAKLVDEFGEKLLEYALTMAGLGGDAAEAAKSFTGEGSLDGLSLDAQTEAALDAVRGAVERWQDVAALKVGRAMSGSRRDRVSRTAAGLRDFADDLDAMVRECEPAQKSDDAAEAEGLAVDVQVALLGLRSRSARARALAAS